MRKSQIYSSYGLIMKELQNTELLLTQAIYSINLKRGKIINAEKAKSIYSNRLKDPFGQLVKIFKDLKPENELILESIFYSELEIVVDFRNHLAHSFFKEFPNFDNEELIEELVEKNEFAFNKIFMLNKFLQKALRIFLKTLRYQEQEIQGMISYFSEEWNDIVT